MSTRAERPRPILVTGAHRSGTTWVGRVLAAADTPVGYIWEPFNPRHRPGTFPIRFPHYFHYVCAENGAACAGPIADMLAFRYRPGAELAQPAQPPGRRPDGARLVALCPQPPPRRHAAREGPDRALLGGVAGRDVRHARPRDDPPPGRVCGQHPPPRLAPPLRRLPRPAAPDARPARPVRGRDPRRRASGRPRSWTRRSCSGTSSTAPSRRSRSGSRTGSSPGTRTWRGSRSRASASSTPSSAWAGAAPSSGSCRETSDASNPAETVRGDAIRRNSAEQARSWRAQLSARGGRADPRRHRSAGEALLRRRRLVAAVPGRSQLQLAADRGRGHGASGPAVLAPHPPQRRHEHAPQGVVTARTARGQRRSPRAGAQGRAPWRRARSGRPGADRRNSGSTGIRGIIARPARAAPSPMRASPAPRIW